MALFSDLIADAQFRADMQGSSRVQQSEWVGLLKEAIQGVWRLAASARPDFQVKSADFAVTSGGSASFTVPPDFYGEVDLVFGPDTPTEYSLGPFAWQNRRAPGTWAGPFIGNSALGGTQARLMGQTMFIEPALRAAGSYRLWYSPRARVPGFIVRLATVAALPSVVASGSGVGKTLTALANAQLVVDSVAVATNDRILVKNQLSSIADGIYTVTAPGSAGTPFVLTRATDFDDATDGVYAGVCAMPTEGTINANTFIELLSFGATGLGAIDLDSQTWFTSNGTDQVLSPFDELIRVKTAIPAVIRDDRSPRDLREQETMLAAEATAYFRQVRTSNVPSKVVDTDMIGPRWFGGGW